LRVDSSLDLFGIECLVEHERARPLASSGSGV
jgi:hypothetical protein